MANQRNFQWYRYVDDTARNWAVRVDKEIGDNVAFGFGAFNAADPPFGPESKRHHMRRVVYRDPTTFRQRYAKVGSAAAYAAAPATLNVSVPGQAAAVTYNLAEKQPEKLLIPSTSRNLADLP